MGTAPGTDAPHPHGSLDNPDVAHEQSDIDVRAILWFVVILAVATLAINGAMWGLFKVLDSLEVKNDPVVSPLMAPAGGEPPQPRLQTTPWQDLKEFRADEERHLHSYGWLDEKGGVAHLPIDKAKALLLQRGIPVRAGAPDDLEGTHQAATGESSSARTIRTAGAPPKPGGAQ